MLEKKEKELLIDPVIKKEILDLLNKSVNSYNNTLKQNLHASVIVNVTKNRDKMVLAVKIIESLKEDKIV